MQFVFFSKSFWASWRKSFLIANSKDKEKTAAKSVPLDKLYSNAMNCRKIALNSLYSLILTWAAWFKQTLSWFDSINFELSQIIFWLRSLFFCYLIWSEVSFPSLLCHSKTKTDLWISFLNLKVATNNSQDSKIYNS